MACPHGTHPTALGDTWQLCARGQRDQRQRPHGVAAARRRKHRSRISPRSGSCISPDLPIPPHISPYLPTLPHIPYLPISPPCLLSSPHPSLLLSPTRTATSARSQSSTTSHGTRGRAGTCGTSRRTFFRCAPPHTSPYLPTSPHPSHLLPPSPNLSSLRATRRRTCLTRRARASAHGRSPTARGSSRRGVRSSTRSWRRTVRTTPSSSTLRRTRRRAGASRATPHGRSRSKPPVRLTNAISSASSRPCEAKVWHLPVSLYPVPFHALPRPSTPFHALPHPSTPFHTPSTPLPRPSTPFHSLRRPSTPFADHMRSPPGPLQAHAMS